MSVFENVAFGLRMRRMAEAGIRTRVRDALALVRMSGHEGRAIDHLSGGQRQRVASARALVNAPSFQLLDEPLGALDLNPRIQLRQELRRLHRELETTFIFVTHDQGEALTMSNRVAVMNEGRIVQVATPSCWPAGRQSGRCCSRRPRSRSSARRRRARPPGGRSWKPSGCR